MARWDVYNGGAYDIHFTSLAAEYASDYAAYDHPMQHSFAFTS